MTIREKGYHHWDGQLQDPRFRWLPMFFNGIKTVFKKRFSKILFSLTIAPFLVFLVGIYVSTKPELQMLKRLVRMLDNEAAFFHLFSTNGFSVFMLVMLGIFFGAELISGDKKFNSFPLYFSRPLDRKDYIAGKFSIIMFYFLLFTLVPGLLLYLFKVIFTGSLAIAPQTLIGLVLTPILVTSLIASITLMVSSLSSNARYVKIIVFVIYFFSEMLGDLLSHVFKIGYLKLFSIKEMVNQVGGLMYDVVPRFRHLPWSGLAVMLVIIAGSFLILYKRIGRAEAQIETGN
ncbi:MAG: ABC transporter permease subunit [bacterium]|nr:ABC transporter permease subunit [bacterium]